MKVQANQLFAVVRQIVQEEIKKSLPGIVRQHLAESYMKKIVSETVSSVPGGRPLTMANPGQEEREERPVALPNSDLGIYEPAPQEKNEGISAKLFDRSNPLSFVYEGVKIPSDDVTSQPGAPVQSSPQRKGEIDFGRMNKLVSALESKQHSPSPEEKMRILEANRRALDIPVK